MTHICNLTDVDDKIINRANEQQLDSTRELTQQFEEYFMDDLKALNIIPATAYPRATDYVDDMMDMINILAKKQLAYETSDGSWYFRTRAQEGYGQQLVQFSSDASEEYVSDDGDNNDTTEKEHFQDFCLWKAFKPGVDREDLAWSRDASKSSESSIKKGRPGWHLECSAMARHFFGSDQPIDLHGGGIDLKFPHHENEIAQSEGANGCIFCNCWFHNGFVNINSEKMSKSLNNFLTLRNACPTGQDVRAYRYLAVSSQYRNSLNFSPDAMKAAKSALKRIDSVKAQLEQLQSNDEESDHGSNSPLATETVPKAMANFNAALRDDLSMPRAAATLFSLVKACEKEFKKVAKDETAVVDHLGLKAIHMALQSMDQIFGIFYQVPLTEEEAETDDDAIPNEVMELVEQRTSAKESKDWELADSLRVRIAELGFTVKDVKGGDPIVSRIN